MFQVLVVEDDQELNRTVCAYLNQNGYQALGCLNANAAYDAMYGGTLFDLIISDIMMPGGGRICLCQDGAGAQPGNSHPVYDRQGRLCVQATRLSGGD